MKKHLTRTEKAARIGAERGLQRESSVKLRVPRGMSEEAKKIWRKVKKDLQELELLDDADAGVLEVYCEALANFREMQRLLRLKDDDGVPVASDETIKMCQSWSRIVTANAEKLGLTPNGRARLAKKRAEDQPADEMEQLLGAASDYLQSGGHG